SQKRRILTRPLLRAVRTILCSEGAADAEVSILITDDIVIRRLNRDFRSRDNPTDVLSFSQREKGPGESPISMPGTEHEVLGDIVISVDTAERQAAEHGLSLEHEAAMLAVHGTLHLLGYEDETEGGAELMRVKECQTLNSLGIPHRRGTP